MPPAAATRIRVVLAIGPSPLRRAAKKFGPERMPTQKVNRTSPRIPTSRGISSSMSRVSANAVTAMAANRTAAGPSSTPFTRTEPRNVPMPSRRKSRASGSSARNCSM